MRRVEAPRGRAAARSAEPEAGGHRSYQEYLAGIEGEALVALRHLFCCPVCARVTRLVLLGFLDMREVSAPGRSAPSAAAGRPDRRAKAGRGRS